MKMPKISPLYVSLFFAVAIVAAGYADKPSKSAIPTRMAMVQHTSAVARPVSDAVAADNGHPGVREDIAQFINNNYGASQPMRAALMQLAEASENFMDNSPDQAQAFNNVVRQGRSIDCVFYVARVTAGSDTNYALNAVDRLHALVVDSPERAQAWAAAEARLQGKFYGGVPINEERTTCEFNWPNAPTGNANADAGGRATG